MRTLYQPSFIELDIFKGSSLLRVLTIATFRFMAATHLYVCKYNLFYLLVDICVVLL